jgi:hypothetical protein
MNETSQTICNIFAGLDDHFDLFRNLEAGLVLMRPATDGINRINRQCKKSIASIRTIILVLVLSQQANVVTSCTYKTTTLSPMNVIANELGDEYMYLCTSACASLEFTYSFLT